MTAALDKLTPDQQRTVRGNVRQLLGRSESFNSLSAKQRRDVANALVNVVAYLSDPKAGQDENLTRGLQAAGMDPAAETPLFAQAQEEDRERGQRLDQKLVQEDFKATAGREGAEIFQQLTQAVDFPEFVAGLIDGVFNSIVDASIRQMEAYSKLLESVVKSVNEFATDNFTPNQGRDYLVNRFPGTLRLNVDQGQPRMGLTPEGEDGGLQRLQRELGIEQEIDLDDEESELSLAQRGQLEMARLRQKQLATMVLLGINRIVVTDGLINAKVLIDVRTTDVAERVNRASTYDSQDKRRYRRDTGGWFSSVTDTRSERSKTVVTSATDETSEAKAEAKAKLSGEVRVNFKSETFPLERLASQTQIDSLNQTAQPGA